MDLKYINKNDGYIIDRKFTAPDELEGLNTYKESGNMVLTEVLPIGDIDREKSITEYAFDNMKENILETVKKKYFVSDNGIVNFYFEGNVEKDMSSKTYVKFKNKEIPVTPTNFNVRFEVEVKVTPKNFLKIQYNNLVYRMNSI